MLLPKALKMRAIKDTMGIVADSIGGTKRASAQVSWHIGFLFSFNLTKECKAGWLILS